MNFLVVVKSKSGRSAIAVKAILKVGALIAAVLEIIYIYI